MKRLAFVLVGTVALAGAGSALAAKQRAAALRPGVVGHRLALRETAQIYEGPADGLVDALVTAEQRRLAEAVAAGRLTPAQAAAVAATLRERALRYAAGR
jgi:hypothetical protein